MFQSIIDEITSSVIHTPQKRHWKHSRFLGKDRRFLQLALFPFSSKFVCCSNAHTLWRLNLVALFLVHYQLPRVHLFTSKCDYLLSSSLASSTKYKLFLSTFWVSIACLHSSIKNWLNIFLVDHGQIMYLLFNSLFHFCNFIYWSLCLGCAALLLHMLGLLTVRLCCGSME